MVVSALLARPMCEPSATKIVAAYARITGSGGLPEHCKRAELLRRAVSLLKKIKRILAKRGNRPLPSVAKVLSVVEPGRVLLFARPGAAGAAAEGV